MIIHIGKIEIILSRILRINSKIMSFLSEIFNFLRARKKFWLLPIILGSVLLGGLVVLTQGSAIAPFIYTLF